MDNNMNTTIAFITFTKPFLGFRHELINLFLSYVLGSTKIQQYNGYD